MQIPFGGICHEVLRRIYVHVKDNFVYAYSYFVPVHLVVLEDDGKKHGIRYRFWCNGIRLYCNAYCVLDMNAELVKNVNVYERYINRHGIDDRVVDAYCQAVDFAFQENETEYGLKLTNNAKKYVNSYIIEKTNGGDWYALEKYCFDHNETSDWVDRWYGLLRHEARNMKLDSYFLFLEKNRTPKERFYSPRRKCFLRHGLIKALQSTIDDDLDILSISLIPGGGKTSLSKFFISGVMGWFPNDYSLFYSHSSDITRMYYEGVLAILTDTDYSWGAVFPNCTVTSTNAKMEQININNYKPFPSLQTTTLDSRNAGKVRASKFLMTDDLVSNIEEALNKNTLEKIWNKYAVDARQRKTQATDGKTCKEIMIMTRWSVADPIARIQRIYADNPRAKFIAVPDIDPETGESNFDFDYGGFTVDFFRDQEMVMDEISYKCLYKQEPIEREGLLYAEEDMRRYVSLPINADGSPMEPDAVMGVCDTKTTGIDFMCMPVIYQFGEDYYCVDCVFDNSTNIDALEGRMANMIAEHKMQMLEVESNAGGAVIASNIEKKLQEIGWTCNITTKATETNKETRIIVNADWVKKHVLFKERSSYTTKSDYGVMVSQLMSYTIAGKNKNDDAADCFSMFALFVNRKFRRREVTIIKGGML